MNIISTIGKLKSLIKGAGFRRPKNLRGPASSRGFIVIMAMMIAAEIIIVGAAVHAISLKEQQLSTLAEDSVRAFLAAESALECVLFQDTRIGNFGTETPLGSPDPISPVQFSCGTAWVIDGYFPRAESNSDNFIGIPDSTCIDFSPTAGDSVCGVAPIAGSVSIGFSGYPDGPCADFSVHKSVQANSEVQTVVYARGLSSCNPSVRRLERGALRSYPVN